MKKVLFPFFAALIALGSCKDDFKVSAPYKNITVVYGVLDVTDTAHYIRIQKAFLDESKSAIDMAKVSDSSFYDSLTVVFQEIKGNVTTPIPLQLVDLNNEGYIKQPASGQGFFTSPSYAYKFKHILDPNLQYQLLITNKISGRVDSSKLVGMVNNDSIRNNTGSFFISDFTNTTYTIKFSKTTPVNTANSFSVNGNTPRNAQMIEGHLIFHYVDSNTTTGVKETKPSLDYLFAIDVKDENTGFKLSVDNQSIYAFLKDQMGDAPANIDRLIDSCDVVIYAGSKELYTYYSVNQGQNGGLTGDQIKPNYTNIIGDNVLGVLGSRTFRVYTNAPVESITLDSLMANPLTQPLHIKGRTSN